MTFRRRDRERELQEEVRGHLEMAVRDRVERGERVEDAHAAVRREFGNVAHVTEATRENWTWLTLERLVQDARYAIRVLRKTPAFTVVAVLSLAIAVGATAAIFQVIDVVRLRALPVPRPQELVEITPVTMEGARGNFSNWRDSVSNPVWEQLRDHQQMFSGVLAYGGNSFNLANGGEMRLARGLVVSGSFFDVLEVRPLHGRLLSAIDDRPGCEPRAVISHGFWQREFGGSPAAVGKTVRLESRAVEIVGVAPASFFGLEVGRGFDVAVPICAVPTLTRNAGILDSATSWWLVVMGRLKRGSTIEQVDRHLESISPGIFRATLNSNYPAASVPNYLAMRLHAVHAETGISFLRETYQSALFLLLGLAALVLLIACANLANLMLARATARAREIAIRLGIGASRGRVIRQLMTESLVLATVGACCGFVLARLLSGALVQFVNGDDGQIVLNLSPDFRIIGFTAALGGLTCLLFGLVPALRATRVGAGEVLKTGARGLAGHREGTAIRRALVVVQVAISVVLVFGAVLFALTLRNLGAVDTGFERKGVMMVWVDLRRTAIAEDQVTPFKHRLLDRLHAVPGVDRAATTTFLPVSGDAWGNSVQLQTATGPADVGARFARISHGYFETFKIPLIAGRDFDPARDTKSSPRVAIVNRTMAARFDVGHAIGGRFVQEATPSSPATEYQVVGVVADSKYVSLREPDAPIIYLPMSQEAEANAWTRLAVRGRLAPEAMTAAIAQTVKEMDPDVDLAFTPLDRFVDRTLVVEQLVATLSSFFGSIAALLAVIGLYGVVSYSVTRRTTEIGIRMALGATRARIVSLVLSEAGRLVLAGVALGLILALLSGRFAEAMLFGVRPRDPLSIAAAALFLGGVALLASYFPARAASKIAPTAALRVE